MRYFIRIFFGLTVIFCAGAVYATSVPSIAQVYAATRAGHLTEAELMMHQVLAAHPNSGKAHYVYAEILAAEHDFPGARRELNLAKGIDPQLSFVKADSAHILESRIKRGLAGGSARRHGNAFPWLMLLLVAGGVILLLVIVRAMRNQRPAAMPPNPLGPPAAGLNMGGFPVYPMAPMGGGFLSSLTTGLGMGAGFAAGESVVNHLLNSQGSMPVNQVEPDLGSQDMDEPFVPNNLGGDDFGINDDTGWDNGTQGSDFSDLGGGDDWN